GATARLVSVGKSSRLAGSPNEWATASGDGLGCTNTTALRRSNSSKTGSKTASPRYTPLEFVNSTNPSSPRTSMAYDNSSRDASTSGSGIQAKLAHRSGLARTSSAANSLHQRDNAEALALSAGCTP